MMTMSEGDIQIAFASAERNLSGQTRGLAAIPWRVGATILDIGCGPGVHLDFFRNKGLIGTGLDRDVDQFRYRGEMEHVTDIAALEGRRFDYVFASHVLEHCPDVFATLHNWRTLLKDDGILIIFVPPFYNEVANDHWCTGWNVGQLAMTFVAAGFDCRKSMFYQAGNQVFGFGVKQQTPQTFMIQSSLPHLPPAMGSGVFQTDEFQLLRGDIAFVCGTRIEYLPRLSDHLANELEELRVFRREAEDWHRQLLRIRRSLSWRITAPLRSLTRPFRRG